MAWMDYGYVAKEIVNTAVVLVVVAAIVWGFIKAFLGRDLGI